VGQLSKVEAIVIGGLDYGESDRIVHILSPEHGRISLMARRLRSRKKRHGGILELGNRVSLDLREGRGRLATLDQAQLRDGRVHIRGDLDRIALLAYGIEICGALAREHHPEPRLFGLLETMALILDALDQAPRSAFRLGLEAKALTFAGLAPVLSRCARCEGPLAPQMGWSHSAGGAVHLDCEASERDVESAWLEDVESARRSPLKDLVDLDVKPGPAWLLSETIAAHVGRELRSRSVLQALVIG
jgi:DNA repair protein RecO (recombination protein O)